MLLLLDFDMWFLGIELRTLLVYQALGQLSELQAPNRPFIKLAQQYTVRVCHVLPAGTSPT